MPDNMKYVEQHFSQEQMRTSFYKNVLIKSTNTSLPQNFFLPSADNKAH